MITASSNSSSREQERPALGPAGLRFRSILVATDGTPASTTAVELAARFAKEFHARLHVLHAIMPDLYASHMPAPVPELELKNLEIARQYLHNYAEHIPELRTVKHKEIVFLGSASDAIQAAGESHGVDLLVVGSHARQGLAKIAFGSVAEWAIRRLHYPVLVAGPMCEKSMPPVTSILLATDLSEHASLPAQYADSLAQDGNRKLTVMHVVPDEKTAEEQGWAEQNTIIRLQDLLPRDCGHRCTLKFEARTGDIAAAVRDSARQSKANLIVLGARHRSILAAHVPRTKLTAIIREARCPVLVVPA